jgi:hypothetical protein
MARLFSLRVLGTVALCSAAFAVASAAPYLHAAPAGSGLSDSEPSMTVNHFRKGDRLPLFHPRAVRQDVPAAAGSQTQGKVPLGCDSSFSPVTSPSLATLYGRCMA